MTGNKKPRREPGQTENRKMINRCLQYTQKNRNCKLETLFPSKVQNLHRRVIVQEHLAAAFLRTAPADLDPGARLAVQFIASDSWRRVPLSIISYSRLYREFLRDLPDNLQPDQVPEILEALGRFYSRLGSVWGGAGILDWRGKA